MWTWPSGPHMAPESLAWPTRLDGTEGHTVQQMPSFILMFPKSKRFQTQLRYKIQHKVRSIPISHITQKIVRNHFAKTNW